MPWRVVVGVMWVRVIYLFEDEMLDDDGMIDVW